MTLRNSHTASSPPRRVNGVLPPPLRNPAFLPASPNPGLHTHAPPPLFGALLLLPAPQRRAGAVIIAQPPPPPPATAFSPRPSPTYQEARVS